MILLNVMLVLAFETAVMEELQHKSVSQLLSVTDINVTIIFS